MDNEKLTALARDIMEDGVPLNLAEGIARYVIEHIKPGHFLVACIADNLYTAVMCSDSTSLSRLHAIVKSIRNHVPVEARGSYHCVERWLNEPI